MHGCIGWFATGVAIEGCAGFADLIENAVSDADINTGVGALVFGLEEDAHLAIAEALFVVDKEAETLWVALGAERAFVDDEAAVSDMRPGGVDFAVLDERQGAPFSGVREGESARGENDAEN